MMRALMLVALFLAGCSNLPDRSTTCGNGVIDRGEDCDGTKGGRCDDQCRLLCPGGYDTECADAGPAYKCGADLICHAPSGVFRQQPSTRFAYAVGQGSVADLDGDKFGDVIGFSDVNLDARFGDPDASMTTRSTVIAPFASLNIGLRRRPGSLGDQTMGIPQTPDTSDVLLPTPDGIAGFTARNKTLVSYPFASSPGALGACATVVVNGTDLAEPRASFSLDKHHLAFISRYKAPALKGGLVLSVVDPQKPTTCKHVDLCATVSPQDPSKANIIFDHYESPKLASGEVISSVIAVASTQDPASSLSQEACVVGFSHDTTTGFHFSGTQPLTVGEGPLAFARGTIDAACPALWTTHYNPLNPLDDKGVDYYQESGPPCQIQGASTASFFHRGEVPAGHIPLVPAPAPVPPALANTYEPDVLATITQHGLGGQTDLYRLSAGAPQGLAVFTSPRPMYPLKFADVDNDGTTEGIGIVGPTLSGGQPDIDVLYRTQVQTSVVGFVSYRIATQSAPTQIELGDFDGNSITDIAYTEKLADQERLMISYGTRDRPLDPIQIATFTKVGAMSRIDIPDSIETTGNVLDDLLVVDVIPVSGTSFAPQVEILHGNPQRSMLAYYDPRIAAGVSTTSSMFVGTVAGKFIQDSTAPDLISFEHITPAPNGGTTEQVVIWTSPGSPFSNGFLDPLPGRIATTSISVDTCPPTATLCFTGARTMPWMLPSGRAVVIAADAPAFSQNSTRERYTVTIDPELTLPDAIVANKDAPLPHAQPAVSMWQGDLDGSGTMKLVIALPILPEFGLTDPTAVNEVRVCDVDASGHVTACPKLTDLVDDLRKYDCGAAETGRIGPGGRFDGGTLGAQGLLALCTAVDHTDAAIFRVHPENGKLVATKVISNVPAYVFMSVGDVNGDSVDDVGGVSFDKVSKLPIVSVHLQCDSHDTDCIDANSNAVATGAP